MRLTLFCLAFGHNLAIYNHKGKKVLLCYRCGEMIPLKDEEEGEADVRRP